MLVEQTSEAGETADHVGAPGDCSLNEVEVGSAHEVLGTSHIESGCTSSQVKDTETSIKWLKADEGRSSRSEEVERW